MKKKLMMVAVLLGALSLGACVDDNESASVTAIRNAKAAQLEALARLADAQAEAAKIVAEAEAAYQNALAAAKEQETAEAQARFEAEMETIKAEAEARLWEAKKNAAMYEQQMLDQADERLKQLYADYYTALETLSGLQEQKAQADYDLTRYKSNLASVDEYVTKQTAIKQASIDDKNVEIEAWKTYSGIDKADLYLEQDKLLQAKYDTFAKYQAAKDAAEPLKEASDAVLDLYDADYEGTSTVAAVAALQKYNLEYKDACGNWFLGTTMADARNELEASVNKGYASYDEIEDWGGGTFVIPNSLYVNGYYITISPVREETISLSDELNVQNEVNVPLYSLQSEEITTLMTQCYATGKSSVEETLGSPASDSKLATGYYLTKENQETTLAKAQKTLTEAQEEFTKLEKAYKVASDAKDVAQADYDAKDAAYTAAQEATAAAQTEYNKAVAGGDQDEMDAAQEALDAARKAEEKALEARTDSYDALQDANDDLTEAETDYNTSKNTTLPDAKNAVNAAELALAQTNDAIENFKKQIDNWDDIQAAWTALVTALQNADYATEVKGLAANEAVAAYITAAIAEQDAKDLYDDAVIAAGVVNSLLSNSDVKDPDAEIRTLESEIAELETQIASLKETYVNGLWSAADYEKAIAEKEAEVKGLESQIEVQEAIVEMAKARVEEAIADMTPAA